MSASSAARAATLPTGISPGGRFDAWEPRPVAFVVCDVDGTLVGPTASATDEVVAAVERAHAAGLRVGYATGRMRDAVAGLHRQLRALGPHVLHNGAEVRADGRTIAGWSLERDEVEALLGIADERDDLYLEVYATSGFVVSRWDPRAQPHWDILGAEPLGVISTASELTDPVVPKATFATFSEQGTAWLLERLSTLELEVGHAGSPLTPGLAFVNVSRPGATKGSALDLAAKHLGIDLSAVAAIGDAANDRSMLEVAGTAVAMGQAPREIREVAHLVVPDVDTHGVATALDALVGWSGVEVAGRPDHAKTVL